MQIQLPDGSSRELPEGSSAYDLAASIGEGLAKAALGARVNGELVDLHRPLAEAASAAGSSDPNALIEVAIITAPRLNKKGIPNYRDDAHRADALYLLRHSAAHVMAEAIENVYGSDKVQLAYGPPLDNGFYYDLKLDTPISSDDFEKIEQEMRRIVEEDRPFTRLDRSLKAGFAELKNEGNKYKQHNAIKAVNNGARSLSFYVTGEPSEDQVAGVPFDPDDEVDESCFTSPEGLERFKTKFHKVFGWQWQDLCQGPHVDRTSRIAAFKVMSVASSHWHGDVNSDRFQRVYGTAFFSQAELDQHLDNLEEARKRDHRRVGEKLGLFSIDEKVGQGLILWKPKGAVVRDELQKFIGQHLERQGYHQVFTPHIGKLDLYRTSGHFPYYADSQFPPLVDSDLMKKLADEGCSCGDLAARMKDGDIEGYMLKPMNCPHHIRIYASDKHSYRDLPIRLAEFGTVYRWEQSGELGGMTRVRGFTQDDAHLFVTPDQLADEVMGCIELVKIIFKTLGMDDYRVRVGTRDPDSTKFVGDPEDWDRAEAACGLAAKALGVPFTTEPGEAAFYGPKIDFVVRDVIGREWQLGTVQVDYQLPQRFDLEYVGSDNKPHRPIMIHRAPFGSMERFIGVLIEHFNGAFPLWLSPEQARVLPVSDKFMDYAREVEARLKQERLRVTLDEGNDRLGGKIKSAEEDRMPYMLVVGGKDAEARTVSVRHRDAGDLGAIPLETFVQNLVRERDTQSLAPIVATVAGD
ncbi:MAG: threonine--tRNA ligase [Phycisphaerales bacterium JB063]